MKEKIIQLYCRLLLLTGIRKGIERLPPVLGVFGAEGVLESGKELKVFGATIAWIAERYALESGKELKV